MRRKQTIQRKVKQVQALIALGKWDHNTGDVRWSLTTLASTVGWQWHDRVQVFHQVNTARGVTKTPEENDAIMTDRQARWGNAGYWEAK